MIRSLLLSRNFLNAEVRNVIHRTIITFEEKCRMEERVHRLNEQKNQIKWLKTSLRAEGKDLDKKLQETGAEINRLNAVLAKSSTIQKPKFSPRTSTHKEKVLSNKYSQRTALEKMISNVSVIFNQRQRK